MLIVCPNCATSYRVVPESLGDTGRSVRCVTCHHVWFEEPHRPYVDVAAAFDEIWPSLQPDLQPDRQPDSQIWPPENEASGADFSDAPWMDPGDAPQYGDSQGSDPGYSDALPYDAEPTTEGLNFAPPISRAGPEISNERVEVTTYIERLADRRSFRRPTPARRRRITAKAATLALICVLVLALVTLVAARQQAVRHLPQTASLYGLLGMAVNLRGLQFDNIKTVSEVQDGVPVLVVEGDIIGTNARLTEVPRLRFAVTDRAGNEIYAWTARPDRTVLPPGETLPFRSRLASPPAEASGVTVRFFDGHDATAELM